MDQVAHHIDDAEFRKALTSEENERLLNRLVDQLIPNVIKFLVRMGASPDEAEEIFFIAIAVLWKRGKSVGYAPGFNFYAYLLEVCKHQWYNLLKDKKKRGRQVTSEDLGLLNPDPDIQELLEIVEWESKLFQYLDRLGDPCRKLVLLWANGVPFEEIALKMGYKNAETARQKKHKCMQRLKKIIGAGLNH